MSDNEDLLEELEQLQAERDARLAAEAAAADRAQLRENLDKLKAIDAAEQAHGKQNTHIMVHDYGAGVVIVKRPHKAAWDKFADLDKPTQTDAIELVKKCLVHPSKGDFDQLVSELPALPNMLAQKVMLLAGARRTELLGK